IMWSLDFNPQLPVSPDKSLPQGVLETFAELLSQARTINPDFALASENTFDRALPYVDVSYTRMGDIDMDTALRYTFPEWTSTIFGESPGDFNPMNNGMRYGMVWALAPRHYNDSVDEILTRPLTRYVSELIRIRKQYEDLLFYGRFNDTLGATVQGDADIRYSVFRSVKANDPSLACVVINFGDAPESAEVKFQGVSEGIVIATPFNPERVAHLPVRVSIPPRQLAVIVKRDRMAAALEAKAFPSSPDQSVCTNQVGMQGKSCTELTADTCSRRTCAARELTRKSPISPYL